ncbi:DHH phosphoesterase [Rhypophila sp. PSN 637]
MFFYDQTLQLYINDEPLVISSKIQKAASKIGLTLKWDQNGHINQISYDDVKALSAELGIVMLSVRDYMNLAKREPRVASPHFAEWLDDTFSLLPDQEVMVNASGQRLDIPPSRPGWFDIESVRVGDGLPSTTSSSPGAGRWKIWTQNDRTFKAAAVRSFVTSSGTCSLDMGIPPFAQHPNFMIREAYRSQPKSVDNPFDTIWAEYERKTLQRNDPEIAQFFRTLDVNSLTAPGPKGLDGFVAAKNQEKVSDLIGKKRLLEGDFHGLRVIDLKTMASSLCLEPDADTIYVTGHEHPDADAVVSAVYEAVRRHLVYGKKCAAWSQRVPYVVRTILGTELTDILTKTPKYGLTNDIVLVDCHSLDDGNMFQVKAIIDHHIVKHTFPYYVAISQEVSWSSTVQVYLKMLGSGLDLDSETAKILLESTLIEAEPALMEKMSRIDQMVLDRLQALATKQQSAPYASLMGLLTRDTMSGDPFMMDYKETVYGFSVIKTTKSLESFAKQANENNAKRHLPLTVVKQVVYDPSFKRVVQEQLSMDFDPAVHDKGFKKAIMETATKACEAMHGKSKVCCKGTEVKITDVPHQTPRLLLAPLLAGIVKEHLRFFKSKVLGGMYVSCGFYTDQRGEYDTTPDETPAIKTGICYEDVKSLLAGHKEVSFMSLPQYWAVYHERACLNDAYALKSLRDSNYVELLDTQIHGCGASVQHGSDRGKTTHPTILEAKPALISPEDINPKTGFPNRLLSPDNYGDRNLWRYWSPDREENVVTRGHIFVMNQTCIDLKIGREEKTRQLTFRPVYRDIPDIKYEIRPTVGDGNWVDMRVYPQLFSVTRDGYKHGKSTSRGGRELDDVSASNGDTDESDKHKHRRLLRFSRSMLCNRKKH